MQFVLTERFTIKGRDVFSFGIPDTMHPEAAFALRSSKHVLLNGSQRAVERVDVQTSLSNRYLALMSFTDPNIAKVGDTVTFM